ncbi:hypothetical protein ACIBCM_06225 [Streptomyces sp. NPDC051018]|uniref:hypothetical protein n=1 Tax=Streptomyces sp. NPDC051018 TaxID=3365639 RepID=UPI00379AA6C9
MNDPQREQDLAAIRQLVADASMPTRTELQEIHFLAPDVAIVECVKHVFDEWEPALRGGPDTRPPSAQGQLTFVMVKQTGPDRAGAWRIRSAQTTPAKG